VRALPLLLLLAACAPRALRVPGPLGPVGRSVRPLPVREDPIAPPPPERHDRRRQEAFVDAVVDAAHHYLTGDLDGFRDDCSGFAAAVYTRAGAPIEGGARHLYETLSERGWVHHRKHPELGDLVFFDDTYDANRDGKVNDPLTHVAVVVDLATDGTITMAHGGTGVGRTTTWMNLEHPSERKGPNDERWNNYLRRAKDSDPKGTKYLTGELWAGFATLQPQCVDDRTASR
jgi:hypothetical protein